MTLMSESLPCQKRYRSFASNPNVYNAGFSALTVPERDVFEQPAISRRFGSNDGRRIRLIKTATSEIRASDR
jgi:hypothetical protein